MSLLNRIDTLQTSEYFQANQVGNAELEPAVMTVKIWERKRAQSPTSSPAEELALELRIGKHDVLRKTIFARLENDDAIPSRCRTRSSRCYLGEYVRVSRFDDLVVKPRGDPQANDERERRTDELEPATKGEPNRWRLRQPIDAPADTPSVTRLLAMLANLRAEQLITDAVGDGKKFGLDHPLLEIVWETDRAYRLMVGSPVLQATPITHTPRICPSCSRSRRKCSNRSRPSFAITSCFHFRSPAHSEWC